MTSAEFIKHLQAADPDGTTPMTVGNAAVMGVTRLPAYYDGWLTVIECDDEGYARRGHRTGKGFKIEVEHETLRDMVENDDRFVIEYKTQAERLRYEPKDNQRRLESQRITNEVNRGTFAAWVWDKIQQIRPIPMHWAERIRKAAEKFYDDNDMTPSWEAMPDRIKYQEKIRDGYRVTPSSNERNREWWEETFAVNWDEYSRITIRRKTQSEVPNEDPAGK